MPAGVGHAARPGAGGRLGRGACLSGNRGEIAQSLDFLESHARDVPERQRSVRAAFMYAWKRLSPEDQQVFSSLSVFHGGFSRQAAEQIAGAGLHTLRKLIDRSFISLRQNGQYDIHELLRQFGEEFLLASGSADSIQALHSHYYLALLAQLEKEIKGQYQFEALDQIDLDFENIRAAWRWAIVHRVDDDVNQAVESLYLFFSCRSRYLEGAEFLGNAHELMTPRPGEEPPIVCGCVLARYAWILALHREPDPITDGFIHHSMDMARKSEDQREIAFCYLLLGCYHLMAKQDSSAALGYLERCYSIYLSLEDAFYTAIALLWLGSCHGEVTGAVMIMEYSRQSLEMARAIGNKAIIPFALRNLARGALYTGDYAEAERNNLEAVTYKERMGLRMGLAESKITLSLIQFLHGDLDASRQLAEEGLAIGREVSYMWAVAGGLAVLSLNEAVRGNIQACSALAEESLATPSSFSGNAIAHWALSLAMCAAEQYDLAWQHIQEVLSQAPRLAFDAIEVWLLPVAAFILAKNNNPLLALELLSFSAHDPRNRMGWTANWKPFEPLNNLLADSFSKEEYEAIWLRGKNWQIEDLLYRLSEISPLVIHAS